MASAQDLGRDGGVGVKFTRSSIFINPKQSTDVTGSASGLGCRVQVLFLEITKIGRMWG